MPALTRLRRWGRLRLDGQSSDRQQDGQTQQKYATVQHVGSSFLPNSSPLEALLEATRTASARLLADASWVQNLPRAYEDTMEAWVVRDACAADRGGLRDLYGTAFAATYGPTLGQPVVAAMLADLDVSGLRSMLPGRDERAAVATVRRHPGSRPVTTREPIHPAAPFFL